MHPTTTHASAASYSEKLAGTTMPTRSDHDSHSLPTAVIYTLFFFLSLNQDFAHLHTALPSPDRTSALATSVTLADEDTLLVVVA